MQVTTATADALGRYLDLTSQQMSLTASNMANVDTPGYKTQGFDFDQEMGRQLNGNAGTTAGAVVGNVDGLVARSGWEQCLDGISEGLQLAKSQLQFRMGIELLKHEFAGVMSAIHAEAK